MVDKVLKVRQKIDELSAKPNQHHDMKNKATRPALSSRTAAKRRISLSSSSSRSRRDRVEMPIRRCASLQKQSVVAADTSRDSAAIEIADATRLAPTRDRYYDDNTALTLYLSEVGRVALLTPEQEVKLAARIKKGDAAAREHMIRANLRLVVKIARDYDGLGLPLLDLINEGNIGLMKAVERFDPAKGAKLSSYGSWWIKQSMRRAIANQGKTIRLPVHAVDKIYHMRRAEVKFREIFNREPSDAELAAEVGMSSARIAELRLASMRPASLDASLSSDEDSSALADVVSDENAAMPFERMDEEITHSLLRELVTKLNEREASIIRYRFGLDGGRERTLEDVGVKFGVTRERIRQLQNLALAKLRRMMEERDSVSMSA
jgi:RNA polymerase primary sigma factor